MLKIDLHLVLYRYEILLALIVLLLTGSIAVTSYDVRNSSSPVPRPARRIALTFDDGPHPGYTDRLIALLQQQKVPATFFVVGRKVLEHPELVRHLAAAGEEVGSHTFTHRNLTQLSEGEVARELVRTRRIIEDITGRPCLYFRPPGGRYTAQVVDEAHFLGQRMVLWTVFPKDHEENDPDRILGRVISQSKDGGIVLLHSGRPATMEALPRIIAELRSRGYSFVTVTELWRKPAEEMQYAADPARAGSH